VDKNTQKLFLYEQHSPLSLREQIACTTGQTVGDKLTEGDLRTPEGVYFLESKLIGGLDFDLYGDMAYVLNFPNPVDRIRGKTGSGIWIHGRGHPVIPRETKGCVALYDPDLDRLDKNLYLGMPLIIAEEVVQSEEEIQAIEEDMTRLVGRVDDWARAWSNKSEEFFSFFDPAQVDASRSENFAAFAANKRNLFKRLSWIDVMAHDIRVIPGPDYWVTYFGQYYRSPFLVSEGLNRFYWRKNEQGEFKIVGREWERRDLDLEDEYLEERRKIIEPLLENWRESWEKGDLKNYLSHYAPDADQDGREGLASIAEQKKELWKKTPPRSVIMTNAVFSLHSQGLQVTFTQVYTNRDGYSDKGAKTLILRPAGDEWLIVQEDWRPL